MYAVQQPLAASALGDVMGVPAWKSLPSWYLVADGRRGDPARRRAPVRRSGWAQPPSRSPSSHVAMVSHPDDVVQLIETAAKAVQAPS